MIIYNYKGDVTMEKNNIINDSYYLINMFHKDGKEVTQLHIQKLMFLFEAYYMNKYSVDKLYNCDYLAWDFGPVVTHLYKTFKKYGKNDIVITDEEREIGNSISSEKKETLEEIYNTFKNFKAIQLVNFTHAEGSPWKKVWEKEKYSKISKKDMKDWFSQYISNV